VTTITRFQRRRIIQAWTDSNNKIAMAIYSDGTVYLKAKKQATVKKMQVFF
jgi:hypothetical protein